MTKDEALKMALKFVEDSECGTADLEAHIKEALAQVEPNYKKALEVWLDKTEWVQETVKPHELGMHRADVLKQRIQEASPQRTWVGLTDGEVDKMILLMGFPPDWITENAIVKNIVRNLEAKLKEKNT